MLSFSVTPNTDFKGMPLFDIECLRNDTRQRHSEVVWVWVCFCFTIC